MSGHTGGIIPQILFSLPEEVRLALTNAIYLNASWLHPFDPTETSPAPFYGHHRYDNHDRSSSVEFMHETDRLPYGAGRDYVAVELPYRASTLSLLVVLPVGQDLGALQHQLSARGLARIVHGLSLRDVQLSLPRFHLMTQISLKDPLRALGMTDAFSETANFSGITAAEQLKIGFVEHAADLRVDEAGTVAAAATVVGVVPTAGKVTPRDVTRFNANRPFLFFLRDDRTGAVLFAGRLTNPASAGA